MKSIDRNHPGQAGKIHLANLIWFPRTHREIVTPRKGCQPCIKIGKSIKPVIPKNITSQLSSLNEPNKEIQLDFIGQIQDENLKNTYILASVDRYSRYSQGKVHHNCDTKAAIDCLNKYIKFHCITRNIRCDQAQAFKSRQFVILCSTTK